MKVEIEIPDPPEGWVYEGYRQGLPGELTLRGGVWMRCEVVTGFVYHIAVKAKPLWEPSPELVAVLKPGWIAKDHDGNWYWYVAKPTRLQADWEGTSMHSMSRVRRTVLPPDSIPWDQSCFKIGEPQE
jgi:hypothetical protein